MTDLTEQWKKGELPEETECYVRVNGGIYLGSIRYKNGYHNKKLPYIKSFNGQFITKYIEKILAPVPSYEEHLESESHCVVMRELYDTEKAKNAQLKELLKECKLWFDWYHIDTGTGKEYIESWHKKGHEIHVKIDEVLK